MLRRLVFLLFFAYATSSALRADPVVTATYEPVSEDFRLRFTLHNTLDDEVLVRWYVSTSDAYNLVTPQGWDVRQNFREVRWDCQTPPDQVQPGQSLGGFGYDSQNSPGELLWHISSNRWGYYGTVTPTLIPEPSSLLALGGGLAAFGIPFARRRRRRCLL